MSTSPSNAAVLFPRISMSCIDGTARSVRHRQQEFQKLQRALVHAKSPICAALQDDNGYSETEALFEYGLTLRELRKTYENISLDAENAPARAIEQGRHSPQRVNGVGMVYIIPTRSKSSLYNILSPLIAAIAAGSCVIVEMPKTTRKLASVIPNVLGQTLSKDTFALSDTLPSVSFLQHCLVVQQNESDSATLEKLRSAKKVVGLPSPAPSFCFVDRTADLEVAVQSVLKAAFAFGGSSPYAPNIVFVHEAVEKDFSATLKQFAGPTPAFSSAGKGSPSEKEKRPSASRPSVGAEEKASIREVVLKGPRGRIVFLHQGTPPTEPPDKKTTTAASASHLATLCLASTKGLDDALNWAEEVIGDPFRTAAGAFIFASSPEANYLANALNADVTCVNSFPPELLVGSRWPTPIKINAQDPSTLLHQYAREVFEEERAVVLGPSPVSQLFQEKKIEVFNTTNNATGPMAEWVKSMQLPLNPMNQRLGRRIDFFEGALLTTVFTVVLPAMVCLGLLGNFVIARLDGR